MFVRLLNAFKNSVFEAHKLVTTKTLVLEHYYRRQGSSENENKAPFCGELSRSGLKLSSAIENFKRDSNFWAWIVKAGSLQCGFWPRNYQTPIWVLPWIFWWISTSFFFQGKRPEKIHQKIPHKIHPGLCSEKFPSDFCRSLFLMDWTFQAHGLKISSCQQRQGSKVQSGSIAMQTQSAQVVGWAS